MRHFNWRATAPLLVAVVICGLAGHAGASASHGQADARHHVKVKGTESDPEGLQPDGAGCSVADGGCRVNFTGHVTFAGDMRGTAAYALHFNPVPAQDGVHYTGSEQFASLATPCGTGSVSVQLHGVYQTTTIDIFTHTTTTVEHGVFRNAKGALRGMTGSFTVTLRDHTDGTTDGSWTGALTCPS